MNEASFTTFRVPARDLEQSTFASTLSRGVLRLLAHRCRSEFLAFIVDPRARILAPLGALTSGQLRRRVEAATGGFVIVTRDALADEVMESMSGIAAETAGSSRFVLLMPRRKEPPRARKAGRDLHSLACDPKTFCELSEKAFGQPKSLAYHAAIAGIDCPDPEFVILSRQLPFDAPAPPMAGTGDGRPNPWAGRSLRVVIPHRGELFHLRNCLRRTLLALRDIDARVHVALDEAARPEHDQIARAFPAVKFWRVTPFGGGPYVPRHILGVNATESFVALQDSDDVPTRDRFRVLLTSAEREGADVVGSHVLDLHENRKRAKAMRYPIDAVTPLDTKPQNTVFHPTILMRTTGLRSANGFSTVRRFASDREFNLRAYFLSLNLQNVDEFLYVRRMRDDSLIHSPETGMKSAARRELHRVWADDYRRILAGELKLEESALRATHCEPLPVLEPVGVEELTRQQT